MCALTLLAIDERSNCCQQTNEHNRFVHQMRCDCVSIQSFSIQMVCTIMNMMMMMMRMKASNFQYYEAVLLLLVGLFMEIIICVVPLLLNILHQYQKFNRNRNG